MGEKPVSNRRQGVQLMRHNSSKPFSKENCYWRELNVPARDVVTGKITPTYYSWSGIRRNHRKNVCKRWAESHSFQNFFEDMGEQPKCSKLARHNTLLPYSKENCYWKVYKSKVANESIQAITEGSTN